MKAKQPAPTPRTRKPRARKHSSAHAREFEKQCLPHRGELHAAALRMTRHPDDAGDLLQETFLRAFAAWPRFTPGTNARAWLYRIMTNSFINQYRRRRRHARFASECPGDAVAACYGDDRGFIDTPEDELLGHGLGDEVTAALAGLSSESRQVLEMADLHGAPYREIAETLGLPLGTVMSRLFRARRKLEPQLRDLARNDYGLSAA